MCFHVSRFESRLDGDQSFIQLHLQDRSSWNKELIRLGEFYIDKSTSFNSEHTVLQIEAVISSVRSAVETFESTN